jgi:hypothetical protein
VAIPSPTIGADQLGDSPVVHDQLAGRPRKLERRRRYGERGAAERKVDVEDPPPAGTLGEEPADQRAHDAGDPDERHHDGEVAAPVAGADDLTDDRLGPDEQSAGAGTLDAAEHDELGHRPREAGQHRPDQEHRDGKQEDVLAPEQVAHLAVGRHHDRRSEQVRGHNPREVSKPV